MCAGGKVFAYLNKPRNSLYIDADPEDLPMLKSIRIELPRYERFASAVLSVAQFAGVNVRIVLQSLRPKIYYR